MRSSRRKDIAAYIARHRSVTMTELCEVFDVSMNTIRADVAFLTSTGTVEKIYGGVRSVPQLEVPLFAQRTAIRPEAKLAIARAAAGMFRDGDSVYIDAGTTAMHVIDMISPDSHVTIITGNLYVVNQASLRQNIELIVLPGILNRRTNSVADVSTLEYLGRYNFSKAVLGTTGLSYEGGLNVSSYLECEVKRKALQQSTERILLCDSSKYGSTGLISYASLADITRLITDSSCNDALRRLCAEKDTQLTVVNAD